jgi:hypothetical protein
MAKAAVFLAHNMAVNTLRCAAAKGTTSAPDYCFNHLSNLTDALDLQLIVNQRWGSEARSPLTIVFSQAY